MGSEGGDVQRGICKWLKYTKERKIQNIFLSKRSLSLFPSDFRRMHNHHIHDPHHHCHQPAWEAGCTLGSAILVFLGLNIAFWTSPVLMVGIVCIGTKKKKFEKQTHSTLQSIYVSLSWPKKLVMLVQSIDQKLCKVSNKYYILQSINPALAQRIDGILPYRIYQILCSTWYHPNTSRGY